LPEQCKEDVTQSKACKDQLLIPKAVLEDFRKRRKNLNAAWINYQKAFDNVPHG
jgi:hypothetical protein